MKLRSISNKQYPEFAPCQLAGAFHQQGEIIEIDDKKLAEELLKSGGYEKPSTSRTAKDGEQ